MDNVDQIRAYVEGRTSTDDFYSQIYRSESLQEYLSQDWEQPRYIKQDNLFLYLMEQDQSLPRTTVVAKGALSEFLKQKGVEHNVDNSASADYDIVMDSAPSWLRLPQSYAAELIKGISAESTKATKVKVAKRRIADDFRLLRKPPKWLQDANWPMADGRPLTFVGQVDVGNLHHDDAMLYIFFDDRSGEYRTLVQVA